MAYEEALKTISYPASGDLSASQYCFVHVTGSQLAVSGVAGNPIGVLQDKPAAAGRPGSVAVEGVTKVRAGGSITVGAEVVCGASGFAYGSGTDAENTMGVALETMSAGGIFSMLLQPKGRRA